MTVGVVAAATVKVLKGIPQNSDNRIELVGGGEGSGMQYTWRDLAEHRPLLVP